MERTTTHPARATLPPELLLLVVEAAAPANPLVIAAPSHPAAQTLLALSRTCRATRAAAARLLRERCAHVGSRGRLARVLECMGAEGSAATGPGTVEAEAAAMSKRLPPIMPLRDLLTSLYLDPFAETLADAGTAAAVRGLLAQVDGTLRRLVVRMPSVPGDAAAGEEEEEVEVQRAKQLLRDGLARLGALEEFVCLGSYPALAGGAGGAEEDAVWRGWPLLERLVLFGAPMRSRWLWRAMVGMPRLGSVVLACPGGGGVNIKRELLGAARGRRRRRSGSSSRSSSSSSRGPAEMGLEMKVMVVDLAYEVEGLVDTEGWEGMDPRGRVRVGEVEVPLSFYGDEERVEAVTAWVRRAALDGSIWGW